MKNIPLLLTAAAVLVAPLPNSYADESAVRASDYNFAFRFVKQKDSGAKKAKRKVGDRQQRLGPPMESEDLRYKVQIENKSLSDVSDLKVEYTLYVSPEKQRGRARRSNSNAREVTGGTSIDEIKRGNRATFETIAVTVAKGGKQGGPPGGGQGGGPEGGNGGPGGPQAPEKLYGIKVELYIGETKVGEYAYGNAAKRAAREGKNRDD